jgi:murein L,D-transpeptidase YcbB/YkuD
VSDRADGERREPVVPDEDDWFATPSDWFVDPGDPPLPTDEPLWLEEPDEARPPAGPPGLGHRQATVVLAALGIVALIAVAILAVRAIGSDDTSGTPAVTTPTVTTPVTTTPTTTTPASTTPSTTPTTTGTSTDTTPASTTPTVTEVPTEAVLKAGTSGSSVLALQNALIQLGYDPGPADGSFGSGTTQAVIAFQAAAGLKQDGIAGPTTLTAINEALARG